MRLISFHGPRVDPKGLPAVKVKAAHGAGQRVPVIVGCDEQVEVPGLPDEAVRAAHGAGQRVPVIVGCAEQVEVPGLPDEAVWAAHGAGQRVAQLRVQHKLTLIQPATTTSGSGAVHYSRGRCIRNFYVLFSFKVC